MKKSMSFRDYQDALEAFDAHFGWRINAVPTIEKMEVNNFFKINIHCDNDKFYQYDPDSGEITEHNKDWRH